MLRLITLPLLRLVMVFVLVTSVIGSFQIFDVIAVTTQGGPAKNSNRAVIWNIFPGAPSNSARWATPRRCRWPSSFFLILVTLIPMRVLRGDQSDLG